MKHKVYHLTDTQRNKAAFYMMLCVFAFVFLLFSSYYTSPIISADNGQDAAFFRLVGQGMTKGYLPYRDFFDMKGPYFFFIEYLGQFISYGRLGIFLVQWINFSFSIFIICDLYGQFGIHSNLHKLLFLLPCAWIACATFEGGNLTEEFSLVPLFLCLNLCIRYFRRSFDAKRSHSEYYGAVYGACFSFLTLVRITNTALICAIVFTICIDLIIKRNWRNLLCNAAAFIAGFAAVFIPMLLFYASQGQAFEMLYAVFVFGYKYSAENNITQHLQMIWNTPTWTSVQYLLLVFLPAVLAVCTHQRDWRLRFLSVSGSIATFAAVISGNLYLHYFTLAIPLLVTGELLAWEAIHSVKNAERKVKVKRCIVLLILISLGSYLSPVYSTFRHARNLILWPDNTTEQSIKDIAEHITESERDSVYCYNLHPDWYTYADLFPCIKYCGWQNHYISLDPEIELELKQIFESTPPKWLVFPVYIGEIPSFLATDLETKYTNSYSNDAYLLYKLVSTSDDTSG